MVLIFLLYLFIHFFSWCLLYFSAGVICKRRPRLHCQCVSVGGDICSFCCWQILPFFLIISVTIIYHNARGFWHIDTFYSYRVLDMWRLRNFFSDYSCNPTRWIKRKLIAFQLNYSDSQWWSVLRLRFIIHMLKKSQIVKIVRKKFVRLKLL